LTFKDLRKRVTLKSAQEQCRLFDRLQNKPFWIWDIEEHKQEDIRTNGDCCFNHIIGLPQKDGQDKPLYDYEQLIFDVFAQLGAKHVWIKKATGLGVTEFFLRFMAWLCLKDNKLAGSQMCIVTGPNIDIAIKLIKRMKALFELKLGITFSSKETALTAITKEAWNTASNTEDKREKIQALSLAKECYSMKLDLLTNPTVVDDAIRFVAGKSKDKDRIKSACGKGDEEESNEPDYGQDEDRLEEKQEEKTEEIISSINQVF
jgi:hypothetical protein